MVATRSARGHNGFIVFVILLLGAVLVYIEPVRAVVVRRRCGTDATAVQVLGSGGPFADTNRASSSYLVWRAGRAVVMIDAGGGAFLRFGEAGARLDDLALLAISHLHPDHVSDLPALLWVSERARQKPLKVAGPSSGPLFPDISTFLHRMFNRTGGAFPVLGGTVGQAGNGVLLDVAVVDVNDRSVSTILKDDDLEVTAIGVPHTTPPPWEATVEANVPTLAYRVRAGGFSIVFSGDQTGRDQKFVEFATGADVLVMHFALSTLASEAQAQIHATPTVVGQVARNANVKRLVLSHFMQAYLYDPGREGFSLSGLDHNIAEVKKYYSGPIVQAADLQCISLR